MNLFMHFSIWLPSDNYTPAPYGPQPNFLGTSYYKKNFETPVFADLVGFYTHWTYMHIFLSNYWWQKSDIWSQASYRYPIFLEAFLDPSDSYFLFADFVDFYTRWTYMHIFLSHYWWQKSDIWSQASYKYPISWEAFLDRSDSFFLFVDFVDFYTHLTYICICTFF